MSRRDMPRVGADVRLAWYGPKALAHLRRDLDAHDLDPASARGEGAYGSTILDRASMRGERRAVEERLRSIDWAQVLS